MEMENITFSEINQTHEEKYCMFSFLKKSLKNSSQFFEVHMYVYIRIDQYKYNLNMIMYIFTQTHSHTQYMLILL